MAKQQKFFWCYNNLCLGWAKKITRPPISECAQELNGKRLCRLCYDAGFRLEIETRVIAKRQPEPRLRGK